MSSVAMQDDQVADVEGRQHVLGEGRRGVDDDEVVGALGHTEQLPDRRAGDAVGVTGLGGGADGVETARGAW